MPESDHGGKYAMKNLILSIVLFVMPALAQGPITQSKRLEFIGDSAAKVYYPLGCDEAFHIDSKNYVPLFSKADADKKGFHLAEKCSKPKPTKETFGSIPPKVDRKEWVVVLESSSGGDLWPRPSDPKSLFELIAHFPDNIRTENMLVRMTGTNAQISYDRDFRFYGNYLGFLISDGTESMFVYMVRSGTSGKLWQYLADNDDKNNWALVTILPVKCSLENCWGELMAYKVFKKIND
jgi:hypothetical protein